MTASEAKARIYAQAVNGSPVNPQGVPRTLANLLVAQAQHETGNFTSNAFVKHNNAFGYAYAKSRYQQGAGLIADNKQPVADYANVEDSVNELVDYLYRRVKDGKFPPLEQVTSAEQYATLLKNAGYYGDTLANYMAALKRFFAELPEMTTAVPGTLLVSAVILLAMFLLFKYRKI